MLLLSLRQIGPRFGSIQRVIPLTLIGKTDDELAVWKETGGYQRSEWDDFKTELAGSMADFDKLVEAADTEARLYVHDA